eukprot:7383271-Prymnesium_polylepis.1
MVRQKNMYQLVDMVMHISPMDQVAEKESFPFVEYYKLLRMPIRAFRILNKNMPAPMQDRSFLSTANIGFIGNGLTPTNHLGIQWYLENCWEDVRRQLPGVRMRLIGRPPGERMVKGVTMPCVKTEDPHCGWAWGTMYSGAEQSLVPVPAASPADHLPQAENGIDELGYLSAEGLLEEVLSWRLMIVPVLRTTGVNTKILVALELGVPLVITPVLLVLVGNMQAWCALTAVLVAAGGCFPFRFAGERDYRCICRSSVCFHKVHLPELTCSQRMHCRPMLSGARLRTADRVCVHGLVAVDSVVTCFQTALGELGHARSRSERRAHSAHNRLRGHNSVTLPVSVGRTASWWRAKDSLGVATSILPSRFSIEERAMCSHTAWKQQLLAAEWQLHRRATASHDRRISLTASDVPVIHLVHDTDLAGRVPVLPL